MSNFFLKIWVRGESAVARMRTQDGAETVQVIMIMGIFALLIAAVFLADGGIRDSIQNLGDRVNNWINNIV